MLLCRSASPNCELPDGRPTDPKVDLHPRPTFNQGRGGWQIAGSKWLVAPGRAPELRRVKVRLLSPPIPPSSFHLLFRLPLPVLPLLLSCFAIFCGFLSSSGRSSGKKAVVRRGDKRYRTRPDLPAICPRIKPRPLTLSPRLQLLSSFSLQLPSTPLPSCFLSSSSPLPFRQPPTTTFN